MYLLYCSGEGGVVQWNPQKPPPKLLEKGHLHTCVAYIDAQLCTNLFLYWNTHFLFQDNLSVPSELLASNNSLSDNNNIKVSWFKEVKLC